MNFTNAVINSFLPSPPGEGLPLFEYQSATQAFLQSSLDIFTLNNIEKKRKKRPTLELNSTKFSIH